MGFRQERKAMLNEWADRLIREDEQGKRERAEELKYARGTPAEDAIGALEVMGLLDTLAAIEDGLRAHSAGPLAEIIQEAISKVEKELRNAGDQKDPT